MPKFWGYTTNNKYAVGCTGQYLYLYDLSGNELARFRDLTHAYKAMFCPNREMFVVKSNDGWLAFYSLDSMQLIKKFRCSKISGSQDDGFCFSKNGDYFYNIERHASTYSTALSIYETAEFKRVDQLFLADPFELCHIEYDDESDKLCVLGFMRDEQITGFAAVFEDNRLRSVTELTHEQYDYAHGYKSLELYGFTSEAKRWSSLYYGGYNMDDLTPVKLSDLIGGQLS